MNRNVWKLVMLLVVVAVLAGSGVAVSSGGPQERLASQVRIYGGGTYGPCFAGGAFCLAAERSLAIDVHIEGGGMGAVYGDWENGVAGQFVNKGEVTCARIDGDVAIVGGRITFATNPAFVGLAFVAYFKDHGSVASTAPDEASIAFLGPNDGQPGDFPLSFPASCPASPFGDDVAPALWTPLRGNVVVQN